MVKMSMVASGNYKVYFYVNYDGETIYFATPMGVLDVQTETLYNHIQQ